MRKLRKLLMVALIGLLLVAIAGAGGVFYLFHRYGTDLPEYRQLANYRPPTVTRVYAGDGRLMQEYAQEKRVFVPVEAMPKRLIQAFLAAEDKNFYSHPGIDPLSIVRAVLTNVERLVTDQRPVGASTITQQVAKNFLLTNEVTFERKIKEAMLAFRIEQAFTKDQILELYLNQIYLGLGSYGVAAAALNYFDKSLDELSTAEAAYLAGLPKAPSWYHPIRQPEAARGRRDWVIGRMEDLGVISARGGGPGARRGPGDAPSRADRDGGRRVLHRGGAARAGRPAWRGVPLRRRPVDPDHPVAAAADARRPRPARRPDRLRPAARLAWAGGPAGADRGLAEPAGRDRSDRGARSLAARRGARGGRRRRHRRLSRRPHRRPAAGRADLGEGRRRGRQLGPEISHPEQVVAPGDVVWVEALPAEETDTTDAEAAAAHERRAAPVHAAPAARGRGRGGRDEPAHRARARDQRRLQLQAQRLQPRDPGAAPARLGAQAVHLSRRPGERPDAFQHLPRRADRDRSGAGTGQVEAGQLQQPVLRPQHAAPGPREVAQRHDRAARADHRHGPGGRHGRALRPGARPGPQPRRGAGRQRGQPAGADHRLRHAGERRQAASSQP